MEDKKPNYSIFNDKIQFDSPDELKQYIKNCDGPAISKFLINIMETANKQGAFSLAESIIVSETLERTVTLLSLIKMKNNEQKGE